MGVNGLWSLLDPAARPIALETLSNKRLAIDASIWLYQFQMAMRDKKTGETLQGAHIMGTFQRIVKLLYHGIKPVFVFDGDAPMLKKRTIAERKRRKAGASRDHAKVAKELLSAQLRATAANELLKHRTNLGQRKGKDKKGKGKAREGNDSESDEDDTYDTGEYIDPNKVVYLEDLEAGPNVSPPKTKNSNLNIASTSKLLPPVLPTTSKRFIPKDQYALPNLEGPLESRAHVSDPRIASVEEQADFLEDLVPEDLDSELFLSLPIEQKYEIIGDMRLRSRQVNHRRVKDSVNSTPLDFSKTQIINLMQRNTLTQKLFSVTDELGAGKDKVLVPSRVAGERNREYVLVKQDVSKGGGWVLGIQDPARKSNDPIVIEDSSGESMGEEDNNDDTGTDDDLFEEVGIPSRASSPANNSIDRETRRLLAIEALIARHVHNPSTPSLDPFLDQPSTSKASSSKAPNSLFGNLTRDSTLDRVGGRMILEEEEEEAVEEMLDPYLQAALAASLKDAEDNDDIKDNCSEEEEEDEWEEVPTAAKIIPKDIEKVIIDDGNSSDDTLEYLDEAPLSRLTPQSRTQVTSHTPVLPFISAALQAKSLSAQASTSTSTPRQEDLDDSDAFEEVVVSAITVPSILPPIVSRPSIEPSSHSSKIRAPTPLPLSAAPSLPIPVSRRIPKSLMDSILPSDSSDSEEEEAEDATQSTSNLIPITLLQPARPLNKSPFSTSTSTAVNAVPSKNCPEYSPEPFMLEVSDEEADEVDQSVDTKYSEALTTHSSNSKVDDKEDPSSLEIEVERVSRRARLLWKEDQDVKNNLEESIELSKKKRISLSSVVKAEVEDDVPLSQFQNDSLIGNVSQEDLDMDIDEEMEEIVSESPTFEKSPIAEKEQAEEDEDEDEERFEWEKSLTPPPRKRKSNTFQPTMEEDLPSDLEEEPDFIREEREENERKLLVEQDQYENMERELTNKSLEDMRKENQAEVERLKAKKNQVQRNADGVTRAMASDIKELLHFFGIPYVDAPEEAEAECAQLLQLQLVDGIVTDDSDVFLFGGARVFRNMFNDAKIVQCYLLTDLEKDLGLDRDKLVRLAYLLGGDYTDGLIGVGPVLGRELLEEFKGKDGLKEFKEWWLKVQNGKDIDEDNFSAWRRKFKKGHKNLFLDESWPNPVIAQAYYKPKVNHDDEAFSWSPMDLDGLRTYLYNTINRSTEKTDALLVPLIKRQNARKNGEIKLQANLGQYFDITAGIGPLAPRNQRVGYQSARLQNVVQSFRKSQKRVNTEDSSSNESSSDEHIRPPPLPKRRKSTKKASLSPTLDLPSPTAPQISSKCTNASASTINKSKKKRTGPLPKRGPAKMSMAVRRKAEKQRRDERAAANGGIYSDDDREEIIAASE